MIRQVEGASLSMRMVIYTLVNLKIINLMVKEYINIIMERCTKVTGLMTKKKGTELKRGLKEPCTAAISKQTKSTVKATWYGVMVKSMKDNGQIITYRAKVNIPGKTKSIQANGRWIKCTEMAFFNGKMGESIKENLDLIWNMGMVHINLRMDPNI